MKLFLFLNILSFSAFAATSSIKFTAKTDGPGIAVEGEVIRANVVVDFNKLEVTKFTTDVMDLITGMDRRDTHMHEKVFGAKSVGMAKIEYSASKVTCPTSKENEVDCDCVGNLKIKDVSNEIQFKMHLNKSAQVLEGKTPISLKAYKLVPPSFMGISVLDAIELSFKVSAK